MPRVKLPQKVPISFRAPAKDRDRWMSAARRAECNLSDWITRSLNSLAPAKGRQKSSVEPTSGATAEVAP